MQEANPLATEPHKSPTKLAPYDYDGGFVKPQHLPAKLQDTTSVLKQYQRHSDLMNKLSVSTVTGASRNLTVENIPSLNSKSTLMANDVSSLMRTSSSKQFLLPAGSKCYVEEQQKQLENFVFESHKLLKSLNSRIAKFLKACEEGRV